LSDFERLKMRTNENARSTADDGITLRVLMAVMALAVISAAILERFNYKCVSRTNMMQTLKKSR
jgi:hypothetical protein